MSSPAFISFSDAMMMVNHKKLGHKLPTIAIFDGVTISSDLFVYGYQFGDQFSDWNGMVHSQSMIFNRYVDHSKDSSSINVVLYGGNFSVSLTIDQPRAGHDFNRADIRVFHDDTDINELVFPYAGTVVGTKDNMIIAMQRCNIMRAFD